MKNMLALIKHQDKTSSVSPCQCEKYTQNILNHLVSNGQVVLGLKQAQKCNHSHWRASNNKVHKKCSTCEWRRKYSVTADFELKPQLLHLSGSFPLKSYLPSNLMSSIQFICPIYPLFFY